jgi:plastocyanin
VSGAIQGDKVRWNFDKDTSTGAPMSGSHNIYLFKGDENTGTELDHSPTFSGAEPSPDPHWTYTFTQTGHYTYICSFHGSMHGELDVAAGP